MRGVPRLAYEQSSGHQKPPHSPATKAWPESRHSGPRRVWRGDAGSHARGQSRPGEAEPRIRMRLRSRDRFPHNTLAKSAHFPLCVCPSRAASSSTPVTVTRNGYLTPHTQFRRTCLTSSTIGTLYCGNRSPCLSRTHWQLTRISRSSHNRH